MCVFIFSFKCIHVRRITVFHLPYFQYRFHGSSSVRAAVVYASTTTILWTVRVSCMYSAFFEIHHYLDRITTQWHPFSSSLCSSEIIRKNTNPNLIWIFCNIYNFLLQHIDLVILLKQANVEVFTQIQFILYDKFKIICML